MIPAEFMVGKMISKNNFVNRMGPPSDTPNRMGTLAIRGNRMGPRLYRSVGNKLTTSNQTDSHGEMYRCGV